MNALIAYLSAHHAQLAEAFGAGLGLVNLLIKLALWVHPVQDWVALAEKRPRLAALLRLSMALGIEPVNAIQSAIDLLRNEASKGTLASMQAFKVSASKPLISSSTKKSERVTLPPSPETPLPSTERPPSTPTPAPKDPRL